MYFLNIFRNFVFCNFEHISHHFLGFSLLNLNKKTYRVTALMVISCEIFHFIHFVPRSSIILTLSNIWLYTLQNTKSIEIARELVRNWIEISFPVPVPLTPLYNYSKKCFKGLWQLAAHTETSQLISFVSQLPGFYMIWTIEGAFTISAAFQSGIQKFSTNSPSSRNA